MKKQLEEILEYITSGDTTQAGALIDRAIVEHDVLTALSSDSPEVREEAFLLLEIETYLVSKGLQVDQSAR